MKLLETRDSSKKFHDVQVTINDSEGYAQIVEVIRESRNGPGFVVVTSITAIEKGSDFPNFNNAQNID